MGRYHRRLLFGTILIILSIPYPVQGKDDEFYKLRPIPDRFIPQYIPCVYMGSQFTCFTKDQVIELFLFEIRAKYWHGQWQEQLTLIAKKDEQNKRLLTINEENQTYIKDLNERLIKEIKTKNKCVTQTEKRPAWPLWLGGTLAVLGVGSFLGGLLH